MLISRPRSTSTIPDGGVMLSAAVVKCRVEGKTKLNNTAVSAALKVPSR